MAAAVTAGSFKSALDHFTALGQAEAGGIRCPLDDGKSRHNIHVNHKRRIAYWLCKRRT